MTVPTSFLKPCAACGADVHARAKKCPKCGGRSPWAAIDPSVAEPKPPYVVMREFRGVIGNGLSVIPRGRVFTDPVTIQRLKAVGVHLMLVSESIGHAACPHCGEVFELPKREPIPKSA